MHVTCLSSTEHQKSESAKSNPRMLCAIERSRWWYAWHCYREYAWHLINIEGLLGNDSSRFCCWNLRWTMLTSETSPPGSSWILKWRPARAGLFFHGAWDGTAADCWEARCVSAEFLSPRMSKSKGLEAVGSSLKVTGKSMFLVSTPVRGHARVDILGVGAGGGWGGWEGMGWGGVGC